jgi:hypothetical protein
MSNSKEQQTPLNRELPTLTDYHWPRSRDAQKAVEEMSKHHYSLEEIMQEQERLNREVMGEQKTLLRYEKTM